MNLCFKVHNLEKFSSNLGKVHFEGLVHLLRYIRDSNNLGLGYNAKTEDVPRHDLMRQDSIYINNKLMVLSDSIWQDFPSL